MAHSRAVACTSSQSLKLWSFEPGLLRLGQIGIVFHRIVVRREQKAAGAAGRVAHGLAVRFRRPASRGRVYPMSIAVVAIRHAVVAQDVAVVPSFLNDSCCVHKVAAVTLSITLTKGLLPFLPPPRRRPTPLAFNRAGGLPLPQHSANHVAADARAGLFQLAYSEVPNKPIDRRSD